MLACAGTLPAQWATLNLTVINLDRNALTGVKGHRKITPSIPSCTHRCCVHGSQHSGSECLLRQLACLAHTGTIPAAWGTNGSFASLLRMQLFANKLSGSLPAGCAPLPCCACLQPLHLPSTCTALPQHANAPHWHAEEVGS